MLKPVSDPIVVGENAHFLATNDEFIWKIIVTPEALGALTHDRRTPISSAIIYADILMRIADDNLSKIDAILDETVWVMAADVERWLGGQINRIKSQRARERLTGIPRSKASGAVVPLH